MATLEAPETAVAYPTGAFRQAGWAFLFLGITIGPTIRLGNENFAIDLLPDFVGYLMIAAAANRLIVVHRRARVVRNLGLVLAFLAIPTTVQYTVVTAQAGGVTTGSAPLWPLTVAETVLDLVLAWMLCGLVADLAGRAGDEATWQRAVVVRAVYLSLRLALAAGVAVVLLGRPTADQILLVVGAVVVVGLGVTALMMSLLWRAERRCRRWLDVAGPDADPGATARPGGPAFRLLFLIGIFLPLALAVGAVCYYVEWQEARLEVRRQASSSAVFAPARDAFYADLLAGRVDEAYASTTAEFRERVSREQFADLAERYVEFVNRKDGRFGGAGASSGSETLTEYREKERDDGTVTRVTITIRRDRDSILLRQPPPLKVDDFKIEGRAKEPWPGLPFGRPPGRGR